MLNKLKKSVDNLTKIFSRIRHIILTFIFGFLFYLFNFLIANFSNISSFYKTENIANTFLFILNLFAGFKGSILPSSFISMIVLSLLTGILFSLIFYKINLRKKISPNASILGVGGIFLGVFAPGCAACGLGIATFFGLTASFATLPFKGLEISILAMVILTISILRFSYTIQDDTCSIDNHNQKIERRYIK